MYYFSQTTLVDDDKIIHEISFSKFACPPRHNLVCIGVDHWPSSGAQVMIDVNLGCQVSERDQGYRGISYLNASWQLKAGSTRGRLSVPSMQSLQRFWKRIPLCRVPTTSIPGIPQGYIAVWVTVTFLSDGHFRRVGGLLGGGSTTWKSCKFDHQIGSLFSSLEVSKNFERVRHEPAVQFQRFPWTKFRKWNLKKTVAQSEMVDKGRKVSVALI